MTLSAFDYGFNSLYDDINDYNEPWIHKQIDLIKKAYGTMIEYLYIKRTDLEQEAKTIRKYENQAKWKARVDSNVERNRLLNAGLHHHRIFDVRKEQRSTLIAIGFLRGKKYHQIERLAYDQPDWERIRRLVMKYSEEDSRTTSQRFASWMDEALQGETPDANNMKQPGAHRGRLTRWMYLCRQMEQKNAEAAALQAAE